MQLILHLHTFLIKVLVQVHQSRKISHARMTSLHGRVRRDSSIIVQFCASFKTSTSPMLMIIEDISAVKH